MKVSIIVALLGLVGIALGAFFSGFGYFLKIRAERLRTRNRVLYYLLEIRYLIFSENLDSAKLYAEYQRYCEDYFSRKGIAASGDLSESLEGMIKDHLKTMVGAMRPSLDKEFIRDFNEASTELALDNPVLAYRLRGREKVGVILNSQRQYVESFGDKMSENVSSVLISAASSKADEFNSEALQELLEDINADIRLVSSRCSLFTHFLARRILAKKPKAAATIFDKKYLDPKMDSLVAALIEAVKQAALPHEAGPKETG